MIKKIFERKPSSKKTSAASGDFMRTKDGQVVQLQKGD